MSAGSKRTPPCCLSEAFSVAPYRINPPLSVAGRGLLLLPPLQTPIRLFHREVLGESSSNGDHVVWKAGVDNYLLAIVIVRAIKVAIPFGVGNLIIE
ncbi:hypothetical protein Tco_0886516 [Tanacetum coccineum]